MELLLLLLVALIGLARVRLRRPSEFGVDSRCGSDDQHAPLFGAR